MSQAAQTNDHSQHQPSNHHWRLWWAGVWSLLLLISAALLFTYRQPILDQLSVWAFEPSSELNQTVERASLSDTGKFYLYASRAAIVNNNTFNQACGSLQNEQTVVLGCYRLPEKHIYIFKVTDERLNGIVEVTTAHEMLHAAYDRLDEKKRSQVDSQLLALAKTITEPRLVDLIERYKKTEPNAVVNELHSIFGTEVASLPAELESYYSNYFVDRQVVVGLKNKYEKVFTDLKNSQTRLVTELNAIAADVAARQTVYTKDLAQINSDIAAFNAWNQSGVATTVEFNARKTRLERRIAALQSERDAINRAIDTYNDKKAELEALNLAVEGLNESINSKLSPTPNL